MHYKSSDECYTNLKREFQLQRSDHNLEQHGYRKSREADMSCHIFHFTSRKNESDLSSHKPSVEFTDAQNMQRS